MSPLVLRGLAGIIAVCYGVTSAALYCDNGERNLERYGSLWITNAAFAVLLAYTTCRSTYARAKKIQRQQLANTRSCGQKGYQAVDGVAALFSGLIGAFSLYRYSFDSTQKQLDIWFAAVTAGIGFLGNTPAYFVIFQSGSQKTRGVIAWFNAVLSLFYAASGAGLYVASAKRAPETLRVGEPFAKTSPVFFVDCAFGVLLAIANYVSYSRMVQDLFDGYSEYRQAHGFAELGSALIRGHSLDFVASTYKSVVTAKAIMEMLVTLECEHDAALVIAWLCGIATVLSNIAYLCAKEIRPKASEPLLCGNK